MRSLTPKLRQKLLTLEDSEDRIKLLKDKYKGETAYIIAGGPSLKKSSEEYLNEFFKDKYVCQLSNHIICLRM